MRRCNRFTQVFVRIRNQNKITTARLVAGSETRGRLAMAALTPNDPSFQPGFEHVDISVMPQSVFYGYPGPLGSDERPPSSPMAYVSAGAAPFFIAHGDHDTRVLVDGARLFVERLRSTSSRPVVYAEACPGRSTCSTCSTHSASRLSSMPSRHSPPGCGRRVALLGRPSAATLSRSGPSGLEGSAGWRACRGRR